MSIKISLIILDGWGWKASTHGNAIKQAYIPNFNFLLQECSLSLLQTHGECVGLPSNIMGNSEIGHLTIGAGRICKQSLVTINECLLSESLNYNDPRIQKIINLVQQIKNNQGVIHIMGLFSSGNVHSSYLHLLKISEICSALNIKVFLHLFSDGRDTKNKFILEDLANSKFADNVEIATLVGRYFAMDRDNNYDRTQKAWELIVNGNGEKSENIYHAIDTLYENNITDEFFEPYCLKNYSGIDCERDGVIFTNYRADRARQLFAALADKNFTKFTRQSYIKNCLALTDYKNDFSAEYIFNKPEINNTLGEELAKHDFTQARFAETEKFNHVTYFFNGLKNQTLPNEQKFLIPSPKVKSFDLQPEMSARKITTRYLNNIDNFDFLLVNFANPDMLGHTGNLNACIEGINVVDSCLGKIIEQVNQNDEHFLIVTADHGNAEEMSDPIFRTSHTLNKVPFMIYNIKTKITLYSSGDLTQIAPTILSIFNIKIPSCMNQHILINNSNNISNTT